MLINVRPTTMSCIQQGIIQQHGFVSIASWYVYARRFASEDMSVPYHEPIWKLLQAPIEQGQEEACALTQQLWGELPIKYPELVDGLVTAIFKTEENWPV